MSITSQIPPAPAPQPPGTTAVLPADLTAILVSPAGLRRDEEIFALCEERPSPFGDAPADTAWLVRIAPLASLGFTQIEVLDSKRGFPAEDPALVEKLSRGGQATFVHVNHSAQQALVHRFVDGQAQPGWAGSPGADLDQALSTALGHGLSTITAADDGTRLGIGLSSSHTTLVQRGRRLAFPRGVPTALDTFVFHDRGTGDRVALVAFDDAERQKLEALSDSVLAQTLRAVSATRLGPLSACRDELVAQLEAGQRDPRALSEITALAAAHAFTGGESTTFFDETVLPMLSLAESDPVFRQEDLEDIEEESIIYALTEILPHPAPPGGEGSLLTEISDDELAAIAPDAKKDPAADDELVGSLFRLRAERLLRLVRRFDGRQLGLRLDGFVRAWYRAARTGQPEGDALEQFRRVKVDESRPEIDRYVIAVAELRTVLELAAGNGLATALLFYEAA